VGQVHVKDGRQELSRVILTFLSLATQIMTEVLFAKSEGTIVGQEEMSSCSNTEYGVPERDQNFRVSK
jgi:hypothetical protein